MPNPTVPQDELVTPADAVDTQVMAFNDVNGEPYDPSAPSTAIAADVSFINKLVV